MINWGFIIFSYIFIIYMGFIFLFYTIILLISARQLRTQYGLSQKEPYEDYLHNVDTKPVSVIVPAYNEEVGIYNSVRSLLSMHYPQYEIIVVNDGSKDNTVQVMKDRFDMYQVNHVIRKQLETKDVKKIYRSKSHENVYMIDKENGGKADALNAGINFSHYPYICSLDGDSILERDAFLKVMKPMLESGGEIIGTGGSIRVANGCRIERGEVMEVGLSKSPFVVMQVIEYLRAFLIGRIGLSRHNLLLIISGAFGVFQKDWVIKAGGYRTNTVGEDMELVVRLHRLIKEEGASKKLVYIPDPVCWTEAPESAAILQRQRSRWHRGLFEALWIHRKMMFNPKYKLVGMLSMPYFLCIELIGSIVELAGYFLLPLGYLFGYIDYPNALIMLSLALLYGSLLSMSAVLLEEWSLRRYPKLSQLSRLFFYALTETFWYRPLTVIWRNQGLVQKLMKKSEWGQMSRKGISK
ncbi:glycosyl transferase [Pontibacillus yanchengensis Y32]|uniref:Glycosyl transferase n=2 Tax=Pontibacillus yanchengensis TaxID=462910 RepID=A0A0A2TDE5_9BACI|nr:glycosyltransferase [Pontibacillus yanchengensis]KGP73589.1 glycosyl transferase [Pontibacillus yanchengensis Y32]